ncbi:MAG: hypothetical protein ACSW8I_05780 [bacterium]
MGLVKCPECGAKVSVNTEGCPKCGYPVRAMYKKDKTLFMQYQELQAEGAGTTDTELMTCPECGVKVSVNIECCPNCGYPIKTASAENISASGTPAIQSNKKVITDSSADKRESVPKTKATNEEEQRNNVSPNDTLSHTQSKVPAKEKERKSPLGIILLIVGLVLIAGGVAFWYYRTNVYLPAKRDAEAPRYYVLARNINMRSSPDFDVEHNKIGSLSYGTEVIVYDSVKNCNKPYLYGKFAPVDARGKVIKDKCIEGYLAYDYMATKADYFLLNSIFGNEDARKILSEARYKKALLAYFKANNYRGNISNDQIVEYGIDNKFKTAERWQVFCRHEKATSNNIYRSKKYRKDSKYTDLAVIIKNLDTGKRKLLYFVFDDDERFALLAEQDAPYSGYMKDRIRKLNDSYYGGTVTVEYDD